MKKRWILALTMMLTIIGGCSYGNSSYGGGKKESNDYHPLKEATKVDFHPNHAPNQDIVRNSVTDQNPNFLNLNTENTTNNFAIDIKKARDVIGTNTHFNAGPIWRNGNNLHVTVYPNRHFSGKQEHQARAQLEKELTAALPTYDIDVNIKNR